jgi:hypothetical protein
MATFGNCCHFVTIWQPLATFGNFVKKQIVKRLKVAIWLPAIAWQPFGNLWQPNR